MSCNGDCNSCPIQCGSSKLINKLSSSKEDNTKEQKMEEKSMSEAVGGCHAQSDEKIGRLMEEKSMSEAVGGCHAQSDEKIGRLDERNNFNVERNIGCKYLAITSLVVALVSLFVAWTAIRDIVTLQSSISELKNKNRDIEERFITAERAYQNARNTLSRINKD